MKMEKHNTIIIGAGPGGLTAAKAINHDKNQDPRRM